MFVALAIYVDDMINIINQKNNYSTLEAVRFKLIVVMKNMLVIEFHKNCSKLCSLFSKKYCNIPIPKAAPIRLLQTSPVKTLT